MTPSIEHNNLEFYLIDQRTIVRGVMKHHGYKRAKVHGNQMKDEIIWINLELYQSFGVESLAEKLFKNSKLLPIIKMISFLHECLMCL